MAISPFQQQRAQYTPESLETMLDRYKKRRQLFEQETKPTWTDFQPQQLSFQQPNDLGAYERLQEQVMRNDEERTAIALTKGRNAYNFEQLQKAKRNNNLAKDAYVALQPDEHNHGLPENPGNIPTPQNFDFNAPLKTYKWQGHSITLNSSVANKFLGFLNALAKKGYRPSVIGSYNKRNIAGTNTPSLHSYGLAIDIDPSRNPVYKDKNPRDDIYALPPNVGALAAKYGLSWGGNWRSYKDYMHFSVPYGGRE